MGDLVSEPITPHGDAFDLRAMATGEPGLPRAFKWRDDVFQVAEVVEQWKFSSREGSAARGELYLRRHYYRLRMSDGMLWTVYFLRQALRPGRHQPRWFLYTIDSARP